MFISIYLCMWDQPESYIIKIYFTNLLCMFSSNINFLWSGGWHGILCLVSVFLVPRCFSGSTLRQYAHDLCFSLFTDRRLQLQPQKKSCFSEVSCSIFLFPTLLKWLLAPVSILSLNLTFKIGTDPEPTHGHLSWTHCNCDDRLENNPRSPHPHPLCSYCHCHIVSDERIAPKEVELIDLWS